jgi:hypothetical protein
VGEAPASHLRAHVSSNNEEGSMERLRCRGTSI